MPFKTSERREERYPARILVTLQSGGNSYKLYTGDVSFRGLFLCTDDPPELRQLILLEANLPPNNTPFKSHAMSTFSVPVSHLKEGHLPGIGVQFYAQSADDQKRWERFVRHIRDNIPEIPSDAVDIVKRRHRRINAKFEVRPADMSELETFYSRNISAGGMFLETSRVLDIGCQLELTILHPLTQRGFSLTSVVRRIAEKPAGLGLEFTGLLDTQRADFHDFISEGIAALSELEEVEIVVDSEGGSELDFELPDFD